MQKAFQSLNDEYSRWESVTKHLIKNQANRK